MSEAMVRDELVRRGTELLSRPRSRVRFTGDEEADLLLNDLDRYPHAFVIACIMDRQMRAERAWMMPHLFRQRLGSFEFPDLRTLTPDRVRVLMSEPTPLHRFPDVMTANFHAALERIATEYGGDASKIWRGVPSSATLVRRFLEFRGAGPKIATMAANLLVRELKVPVSDKFSIDISPDVHVRRVFVRLGLIGPAASNDELIYRARELNPEYPGVFDLSAWDVGRRWCKPQAPDCAACYMMNWCPTGTARGASETPGACQA